MPGYKIEYKEKPGEVLARLQDRVHGSKAAAWVTHQVLPSSKLARSVMLSRIPTVLSALFVKRSAFLLGHAHVPCEHTDAFGLGGY